MTQPETATPHDIGPDGYCFTCRMVPCQAGRQARPQGALYTQLARIEANQHKIMRHLGIEVD